LEGRNYSREGPSAFIKDEHGKTGEALAITTKRNVCAGTLVCVGALVCVGTLERRPDQASGTLGSNSKTARQRLRCTAPATVSQMH